MKNVAGSPAAVVALSLVDQLVAKLRSKGVLSDDDVLAILNSVADGFGKDSRHVAREAEGFVRDLIASQ